MQKNNTLLKGERLEALTSLRFFAAVLVFLFHYSSDLFASAPFWMQGLTRHGLSAVTFFFILSGFILSYTYFSLDDLAGLKVRPGTFWLSRFSRIYPLYFVALLIASPVFVYATIKGRNNVTESVLAAIFVPLMLQSWIPPIAIEWNPPAWSLSVEAFFYALFPFLARFAVRWNPKRFLVFCFVMVCVSTIIRRMPSGGHLESLTSYYFIRNLLLYFPLFHLPSFLVGVALGSLFMSDKKFDADAWALLFKISLLVLSLVLAACTKLPSFLYAQPVMVLLYSLVIYSGAKAGKHAGSLLTHPILIRLGDASYALYILQAPLSGWFGYLTKSWLNIGNWTQHAWLVLSFFILLIAMSVASFEFVEKTCRKRIQKWSERKVLIFGKSYLVPVDTQGS